VHGLAVVRLPGGGKALLATTNRGLHRSEDNGETWVLQELPSPWPYTRSVMPRADNSGVVFVTNGNGPPGNDGFLLRSRDSWQELGECQAAGTDREHGVVRRHQRRRSDADLRLHQSRRAVPLDRRRRELDAPAAPVRRAARAALACAARGYAARRAFVDATGAEGRADGMGGGMSATTRAMPLSVGLMVPANNTTMEVELPAWLPPDSTVTTVKIPRGQGLLTKETLPAYRDSAIALARRHFARGGFDLIAYGCTAAGFLSGPASDAELAAMLTAATGLPVVTTARAMVNALQHEQAKRIAVVTP